ARAAGRRVVVARFEPEPGEQLAEVLGRVGFPVGATLPVVGGVEPDEVLRDARGVLQRGLLGHAPTLWGTRRQACDRGAVAAADRGVRGEGSGAGCGLRPSSAGAAACYSR